MAKATDKRDTTDSRDVVTSAGYDAWKRAKIDRGLVQSRDRASMIPVEQVWHDLTLER